MADFIADFFIALAKSLSIFSFLFVSLSVCYAFIAKHRDNLNLEDGQNLVFIAITDIQKFKMYFIYKYNRK